MKNCRAPSKGKANNLHCLCNNPNSFTSRRFTYKIHCVLQKAKGNIYPLFAIREHPGGLTEVSDCTEGIVIE